MSGNIRPQKLRSRTEWGIPLDLEGGALFHFEPAQSNLIQINAPAMFCSYSIAWNFVGCKSGRLSKKAFRWISEVAPIGSWKLRQST
jgi:hypothetical protein